MPIRNTLGYLADLVAYLYVRILPPLFLLGVVLLGLYVVYVVVVE